MNEQMVNLSGYDRGQLVGSSFQDYFREPERAAAGVHQTLARLEDWLNKRGAYEQPQDPCH